MAILSLPLYNLVKENKIVRDPAKETSSELAQSKACALRSPGFVKPFHSGTRVGGITFILELTYQVYISQYLFVRCYFCI